jgi:hypothetical protein
MFFGMLPFMVADGNSLLVTTGIILVFWGGRLARLLFWPVDEESAQKSLLPDIIGLVVTIILSLTSSLDYSHAQEVAKESAVAFYDTLQVGAAFDRADFERRVKAGGGRVRNFDNPREAEKATGVTDALWDRRTLYPLEVAALKTGKAEQYHLWFRVPASWGTTQKPFDFAFEVENGKIVGKSAIRRGTWLRVNGQWGVRKEDADRAFDRGAYAENPVVRPRETLTPASIARIKQQSEEDARQRAEALYATLQVGAPFDPGDFERQIRAQDGRMDHVASPEEAANLATRQRNEAARQGARLLYVSVLAGSTTAYNTLFFTPYASGFSEKNPSTGNWKDGAELPCAFYVKNGVITSKVVYQEGTWVDFR